MDYERWLVSYYEGSRFLWQDEGRPPQLSIGTGVIGPGGGARYRVVDMWVSYDHNGHFPDGNIHVFLRDISRTEDDLPHRLAPDYFSG